jgi:hypothetical protein
LCSGRIVTVDNQGAQQPFTVAGLGVRAVPQLQQVGGQGERRVAFRQRL